MKKLFMFAVLSLASTSGLAHEGHDKAPGSVAAPHGGQIKGTSSLFLEIVYETGQVKIYPFDHDMKKVAPSSIKLSGSAKLPKAIKAEELVMTAAGEFFETKVDVKGAHRFTLDLKVSQGSKTEKVSINIEP